MAIEKRISLTIDTSSATAQIKKLQNAMSGVETTASKTKTGDTYTGATTGAKTARKALIDYTGSLSNANRLVIQSSNYATLAEKATLAQDTALRKLNQAYDQGRIDVTSYNAAVADVNSRFSETTSTLNRTTTATGQATSGFKVMRGGLTQLSYQLQDVAVQAQMGTSWFTIIGQQGPQIASILGPFGALLGIVIAVGAALGGVLYKALGGTVDALGELEDKMSSVEKVATQTSSGVNVLTKSIKDLQKQSSVTASLQIAIAANDARDAIALASTSIKSSIDTAYVSLEEFSGLGASSFTELGQIMKNNTSVSADTRESFFNLALSVGELNKQYGLSADNAYGLLGAVTSLNNASSASDFDDVIAFLNSATDNADGTKKQNKELYEMASNLLNIAIQGKQAAAALELINNQSKNIAIALPLTEGEAAAAELNSEFSSTSALLLEIQNEYKRLNELQLTNDNVSIEQARNAAKQATIDLIAEQVSGLDTVAKREEYIAKLQAAGLDLSGQQLDAIDDKAQATKYLYEEQLAYNNSLSDNLLILGEIAGQGAKDYADSVKSINVELQGLVTSTFSSMEDALVSWAETGKASFSDFVNSALSDLLRLIVRQQLAGIATGITGAFSTGTGDVSVGSVATTTSAKGNVISPSTYAKGGVTGMANTVQSTPKYFANGGGLLGEAGSEAIIPLTRTSGGDLGVKMTGSGGSSTVINYNVTNEAGIESTQSQSTNEDGSIDINVINKLVSKSIASGYADKAITNRFNTSKRGK